MSTFDPSPSNPDDRPSAAELRKHKYLELEPGWQFTGFK